MWRCSSVVSLTVAAIVEMLFVIFFSIAILQSFYRPKVRTDFILLTENYGESAKQLHFMVIFLDANLSIDMSIDVSVLFSAPCDSY